MDTLIDKNDVVKDDIKTIVVEFLDNSEIPYNVIEIDGVEKETSNTGVGPVDAAINAIRELIEDTMNIELEEYNLEAINGGTDALADVFVISSDNEGNKSTGRAINDDIVMASILAVLDSINKLLLIQRSKK